MIHWLQIDQVNAVVCHHSQAGIVTYRLRMLAQHTNLCGDLLWFPPVISIQKCNELASCDTQPHVSCLCRPAVLLANQNSAPGILLLYNLARRILRAVVHHDDLIHRVSLLQNTVYRTPDESLAVIDRNNDTYGSRFYRLSTFFHHGLSTCRAVVSVLSRSIANGSQSDLMGGSSPVYLPKIAWKASPS